jgi:hypothetical protein
LCCSSHSIVKVPGRGARTGFGTSLEVSVHHESPAAWGKDLSLGGYPIDLREHRVGPEADGRHLQQPSPPIVKDRESVYAGAAIRWRRIVIWALAAPISPVLSQ